MQTINGRPTINLDTIGSPENARGRADTRPPVFSYSGPKLSAGIKDAARSTGIIMSGSAVAAMIEYSETMYGDCPRGGCTGDN
jgi:hypothetical protein